MNETFYVTTTFCLPKLNWPSDSLADLDHKLCSKFTIYASVGGLSKADTRSSICTDWWEAQNILEEIDDT